MQKYILALGAAVALCTAAHADINGNPLTITATTLSGESVSWSLVPSAGQWSNGGQDWTYQSGSGWSREFWHESEFLGRVSNLTVNLFGDPQVDVNFSIFGGAVPAVFTFSSALVSFAPITGGTAQASAGITVADVNGDGLSSMGSVNPGDPLYRANFNGLVPAGTNYASFFAGGFAAGLGGSTSDSLGPTFIPFAVTDISAQFSFVLSPFDLASGTSTFQIVPSPAGLGAIAAGLLLVGRRRR